MWLCCCQDPLWHLAGAITTANAPSPAVQPPPARPRLLLEPPLLLQRKVSVFYGYKVYCNATVVRAYVRHCLFMVLTFPACPAVQDCSLRAAVPFGC